MSNLKLTHLLFSIVILVSIIHSINSFVTCSDIFCDEDEICCEIGINDVTCCPAQGGCYPSCTRRIFRFLENDQILIPGII